MINIEYTTTKRIVTNWPVANKRAKATFQISNCHRVATRELNGKLEAERFDYCIIGVTPDDKTWIIGRRKDSFFILDGTFKNLKELKSEKSKKIAHDILSMEITV